ncbi:MAG: hypothetical protein LC121_12150 [Anaerolineae bacterium]|nr:hypothetical protein [Anaerolineae bacterium]
MKTALLGLGFVVLAGAACVQSEGPPEEIGAIRHVLPSGRQGAWPGEAEGGVYRVTASSRDIIQYYFLDPIAGTEGRRTVSVRLAIESIGEQTRGGLVYGVTANPSTYYIYTFEPVGRVVLFRREPSGKLAQVWSTTVERRTGEFVTLGIRERGDELVLTVDGRDAGSIRSEVGGRGGVGIAVGGTGTFAFTDFRHDPPPLIPGQPAPMPEERAGRAVALDWQRHETPGVFSLEHPRRWSVVFDAKAGRLTVAGEGGQRVHIWPVLSSRPLDERSAARLLGHLASRLEPGGEWRPGVAIDSNTVRSERQSAQTRTVASLRWFTNASGTSAFCYVSSAPVGRYAAFVDTAARIVSSFRPIVPHRSKSGAPAPSPAIEFVSWRDPAEGAFQVQVPRGWRVDGGLRRRSALDYQRGVNLVSPDGRVVVLLMDRDIPFFTLPDSTTALLGLPEGSWYAAPDGSRMLIRRYVPGSDFAQQYAVNRFSRTFRDLRVERKLDRPDLAAAVRERHAALNRAAAGFMRYSAAAGEVHLTGTRDGAHRGYVASTTVLAQSAVAGAWEVGELYGFFAPSDRVNEAVIVLQRLASGFRWDPQWYRRQHQTRAAVGAIMEDYGRSMAQIVGSIGRAGRAGDRAADRFSEYIRGTVTVRDEQGKEFSVWNTSNYYWIDVFEDVAGTMLSGNPDVARFRELVEVR